MSMRWITIGLSIVAVTAFFAVPKEAHASQGCWDIILVDTKLTHDIGPCVGDGLIIDADDVTVDLDARKSSAAGNVVRIRRASPRPSRSSVTASAWNAMSRAQRS